VAEVANGAGGCKLQLKYPGGEKTVYVPANTPVVKLEPSERSKLKSGEHVFFGRYAEAGRLAHRSADDRR